VVESNHTVERAAARGVDPERARVQLARLGNTAYELAALDLDSDVDAFVPDSVLNALRREAVGKLEQLQESAPAVTTREPADALGRLMPGGCAAEVGAAQIHLLVRTSEQLDAAISAAPASITLDYLDLYGLRPSVDRVRQAGIAVRVAAPRVLKPGEERVADFLVSLGCPILVRSAGLLHGLLGKPHPELTGDFSLNAANAITARMLLDKGLARITPTYDCNAKQVAELAASAGAHRIEAVVYQHLPVFHTEHCVFCRFLSSGTSYLDCGKPCEQHRVALVDEQGRAHPVLADVGCRNTVFGAEAQEASRHLPLWRDAGIYHFRIEFAHETARQVERIAGAFHGYLGGEKVDLAFALRALSPLGTAEGSLFVPKQEPVFRIL
jgi:putative protease